MAYFGGLCYLCLILVLGLAGRDCSDIISTPLNATADGDIIIGGLFPIHESVKIIKHSDGPDERNCSRFNDARLTQALVMIEAVEAINNSTQLGNLKLGYLILDSCSDVTTAIQLSEAYMSHDQNDAGTITGNGTGPASADSRVKVVIGGYHSELSIAVARHLTVQHIPQISYGSTAGILSDKTRFPGFMRTVPQDDHQAHAIVQILVKYKWTWVGLVTTDGDYGRYAADRFEYHARKYSICIAFRVVLPDVLGDPRLTSKVNETVTYIAENPRVKVMVSFAKPDHMMYVMGSLTEKALRRVWVASDNWASSSRVLSMVPKERNLSDIGTIIGVTLMSGETSHFQRYLRRLDLNPDAHKNNSMLQAFIRKHRKVQQEVTSQRSKPISPNDTVSEILWKSTYPYAVFSVGLAVRAITSAVADLCAKRFCQGGRGIQPWELTRALRNATFKMDGESYKFDNNGDLNTGYDIVLWLYDNKSVNVHNTVAQYSIKNKYITFESKELEDSVLKFTGRVVSTCSDSCSPGSRKRSVDGQQVCCYECVNCTESFYTNGTNMEECQECPASHWSSAGSSNCTLKAKVFFGWKDIFADVLLAFAALGALLTLLVLMMFVVRWNTPVVRAAGGPISVLLLLSLLGTFTSTVLFVGRPNDHQCAARQALFGLSFTLCVSCILVKSFKILLAFQFDPGLKAVLARLYKPYWIIGMCVALQVVICGLWLGLSPPEFSETDQGNTQRLLKCHEGSFTWFGVMLAYIGVLALVGFAFAFKGRKLPHSYNEAKFISFGMLIYFICWVMFGPIYAKGNPGVFLPAVEIIVILISAYGILCCHFLPKCYIILCKKESNTREAFLRSVREFTAHDILTNYQSRNKSLTESSMFGGLPLDTHQSSSSLTGFVSSGFAGMSTFRSFTESSGFPRTSPNTDPSLSSTIVSFVLGGISPDSSENISQPSYTPGVTAGESQDEVPRSLTSVNTNKVITELTVEHLACKRYTSLP